jgi:hypothetical protein
MLNSTIKAQNSTLSELPLPAAVTDLFSVLVEIESNQTVLAGRLYPILEPVEVDATEKADGARAPDSRLVDTLRTIEYRLRAVRRHQADLIDRLHV